MEFPLLSLNPSLLEKVINKTKEKSYFRLQQTCHGVNEFIRSRKNISVHIYWLLLFQWEKNEASHIFCGGRTLDRMVEIEDDALYGTRFRSLEYSLESLEDFKFDTLCEILKKYRTTASAAAMHRTQLSKDQLVTILNILKPVWISLNSRGSNRYEALLQSKILTEVYVDMEFDEAAVAHFISTCSKAIITCSAQQAEHFEWLRSVLLMLFYKPCPNLHTLSFNIEGSEPILPSKEEVVEQLDGFKVKKAYEHAENLSAVLQLPPHFPHPAFCSVSFDLYNVSSAMGGNKRESVTFYRNPPW